MLLLPRVLVEKDGEAAADMARMVRVRALFSQVQVLQRACSGANVGPFNSEHRSTGWSVAPVLQCPASEDRWIADRAGLGCMALWAVRLGASSNVTSPNRWAQRPAVSDADRGNEVIS
jgi:hypothetical protein